MTQQIDLRNPSGHTEQTEPPTALAFEGDEDFSTGSPNANNDGTSGSTGDESDGHGRWPSLLNICQAVVAFIVEIVSNSQPLRKKLNTVILRVWQEYLSYVHAYPLLTTFLSCLVFFSAGPIVLFACVTGASLGILVGAAAVVVILLQSIVVSIAGAILLFILGTTFVLTVFTFFWIIVLYVGCKFLISMALVLQEQRQHRQTEDNQSRDTVDAEGGGKTI